MELAGDVGIKGLGSYSLADRCSQTAFMASKRTFHNRAHRWGEAVPTLDHFFCQLLRTPTHTLAIASDGIGTKIEIAERCANFATLGYDLVAMVADDIICCGAEPTHLSNILDVDKLDAHIVSELFLGLTRAANEANMMITGGETAELGNRIGGFGNGMHFNWCATALGILPDHEKAIDGSAINEGDAVISLQSCGLRSNGFSLARKILSAQFGEHWHREWFDREKTWGEQLLTPSLIYAPHIVSLLQKKMPIAGIAHITGGGIAANFERILSPWNKGAVLDSLCAPHEEMKCLQTLGSLSDRTCYETWNMGSGMLLVISPEHQERLLNELRAKKLGAQVAGFVTSERAIIIRSEARERLKLEFLYED